MHVKETYKTRHTCEEEALQSKDRQRETEVKMTISPQRQSKERT